jgi:hypothetical protein
MDLKYKKRINMPKIISNLLIASLLLLTATTVFSQRFTITPGTLPTTMPAGSSASVDFAIINTSPFTLSNLSINDFPLSSPAVTFSGCATLSIGGNCTLTLTLTAPFPLTPITWFTANNIQVCFQNMNVCAIHTFNPPWIITVTPSSDPIIYKVRANSTGDGSITPDSQDYIVGTTPSLTYTLTPDSNYQTASVTDNCNNDLPGGSLDTNNNTYTVTRVTQDCSITANFTAIPPPPPLPVLILNNASLDINSGSTASITVTNTEANTIATGVAVQSFSPSDFENHFATVTYSTGCAALTMTNACIIYFTANTIVNDISGSVVINATSPAGITEQNLAINLKAPLPPTTYQVTANATGNGSITPPEQDYIVGTTSSLTFVVSPNSGFQIDSTTDNCADNNLPGGSLQGTHYIVTTVKHNCIVTANFAPIPVQPIPALVLSSTSLDINSRATASITISNTKDNTTANGVAVQSFLPSNFENSFTNVTYSTGCAALTTTNACVIYFTANAITTDISGSVVINAASPAGITNQNLTVNLKAPAAPTPTHIVTPSIVLEDNGMGLISPNIPITVDTGTITPFTIAPLNGSIVSMSGTCGGTLTGNTYTTLAITQDCTVMATFKKITITSVASFEIGQASGPMAGDTGITVTGTNFPVGQTAYLRIGSNWVTNNFSIDSPSTITANTPASSSLAGTPVDVTLYAADRTTILANLQNGYTYEDKCALGGSANVTYCQAQIQACIYVPANSQPAAINVNARLIGNTGFTPPQCVAGLPKFESLSITSSTSPQIVCTQAHAFAADRQTGLCANTASNNPATSNPINLSMMNVEYSDATGIKPAVDQGVVFMLNSFSNFSFQMISDPNESYQNIRSAQFGSPTRVYGYQPQNSTPGFCILTADRLVTPPTPVTGQNYCLNPGFYPLALFPWTVASNSANSVNISVLNAESQLIS